jgi:hypothetical protein
MKLASRGLLDGWVTAIGIATSTVAGMTKSNSRICLILAVAVNVAVATSAHANVIVAESFGGNATTNLNGITAGTFAAGITSAGGNATWVANTAYKADGSITGRRVSAYLDLGSYVNDAKGTANGIFVLEASLALPTSTLNGTWASLGFAGENAPSLTRAFNNNGSGTGSTTGYANMLYRTDGDIDQFAGAGSGNQVAPDDIQYSGNRTLRVTLDLTPTGGYNGTTNFGTARFAADVGVGNSFEEFGTFTYTSNVPFGSILLSVLGGNTDALQTVTTTYGELTLVQVPEPSVALVGGLGVVALMLCHRRRKLSGRQNAAVGAT